MEASLLIQSIGGLVVILAILLFILLRPSGPKKVKQNNIVSSSEPKKRTDLEYIREVMRDKNSTREDLSNAVDMVIKYHGKIPNKLGTRTNPKFDDYMAIFVALCRHKKATKDVVLKLDRELVSRNPAYKSEINDAITKGLNSRG
jgi:hypothetical protein